MHLIMHVGDVYGLSSLDLLEIYKRKGEKEKEIKQKEEGSSTSMIYLHACSSRLHHACVLACGLCKRRWLKLKQRAPADRELRSPAQPCGRRWPITVGSSAQTARKGAGRPNWSNRRF